MNAYTFYKVGDTFHNDNGEDYLIIALSKEQDKAILCKTADDGTPFYIGAKGLSEHCWAFGHYFMSNLMKACQWFYEDNDSCLS